MERAGYGPDKRLAIKVSVRNTPAFRDPAAILIDQLREIFIDGELETVDTVNWFPKVYRKDYKIGLNLTGAGVDDPDAQFYENYACGSDRNYTGYCNPEIDRLFDQQSMERDQEKRRRLVWEIDRRLQEDEARPILFHNRFATCWHPQVKGLTIMVNSLFNGWRMEDRQLAGPDRPRDHDLIASSMRSLTRRSRSAPPRAERCCVHRLSVEPLLHRQRDGVMRLAMSTLDLSVQSQKRLAAARRASPS